MCSSSLQKANLQESACWLADGGVFSEKQMLGANPFGLDGLHMAASVLAYYLLPDKVFSRYWSIEFVSYMHCVANCGTLGEKGAEGSCL